MKKILTFLFLTYATPALAAGGVLNRTNVPKNTVQELITMVINAALGIIATVAVLFLIIGGLQYVMAAGNPDSIGKAKSTILYSIIGLVISIIAYAVVKFITDNLV